MNGICNVNIFCEIARRSNGGILVAAFVSTTANAWMAAENMKPR
jgi:hypothetical protein